MPYRKKHLQYKIRKIKPPKSILRRLWFWVGFLIIIFVLSVCYFILFYPGFQVKNVVLSGDIAEETENYLKKIILDNTSTELIDWNIFRLFSNSIFLVDKNKTIQEVLKNFPIIENVYIKRVFPQTIKIDVRRRAPVAVFCQDQVCFLIDKNGFVFENASEGASELATLRQTKTFEWIALGERVVGRELMDKIYKIQNFIQSETVFSLKSFFIVGDLKLDVIIDDGWKIYFDLSQNNDIDLQLIKLDLLLNNEITENQMSILRYINLAPKDRAIICDNSVCENRR